MTDQDKIVDRLYDDAFDAINRVSPDPMKDFAQVGSPASITIQIQALSTEKYSIRIVGQNQGRPHYVQGSKTEILFSLRSHIRNVIESDADFSSPPEICQRHVNPEKGELTQKQLDDLLNEAFPILPSGRP